MRNYYFMKFILRMFTGKAFVGNSKSADIDKCKLACLNDQQEIREDYRN